MADSPKVKKLKADIRSVNREISGLRKDLLGDCDSFKHDMEVSFDNFLLNETEVHQAEYDGEFPKSVTYWTSEIRKYIAELKKLRTKLIKLQAKLAEEQARPKK